MGKKIRPKIWGIDPTSGSIAFNGSPSVPPGHGKPIRKAGKKWAGINFQALYREVMELYNGKR